MNLEICGFAVGEYESRGAKGTVTIARLFVVDADLGHTRLIFKVPFKHIHVEPRLTRGFQVDTPFAMILARRMLRLEQSEMEPREGLLALFARGDRGEKRGAAATAVLGGLLPQLPLWSLSAINLIEWEKAPVNLERVA